MTASGIPAASPGQTPSGSAVFKRLWKMLRPQWPAIFFALFLLILSMPGELFPAFIWRYVTDDLILPNVSHPSGLGPLISLHNRIHDKFHLLLSSLVWLMVIFAISTVFSTLSTVILQRVAQKFVYVLRNQVYHKLQTQSLGYLQKQRSGDLISRAMGDVDELQNFVVNSIDLIIGDGGLWLATVGIVMVLSWQVTSSSLAPLLVVFIMLRHFNAKVKPIYAAVRERAGDVTTRLQENLSGITVIKIFGREKEEAKRFDQTTLAYYTQQLKAITARNLFFPFTYSVGFFSNIFMIGVGGYLLLRHPGGSFTVGTLLLFRAYWWRLFGPVQTLARVNDLIQRARAAGKRVFEVLDAPEELPDAADAVTVDQLRGSMQLRNVSFRYPADTPDKPQPYALQNVNLRVEPGQTVAVCGPSGSGKSTVLNLLLRFYDPTDGQVTLDGRDIRSVRRDSFRRKFALVQQETFLFNDSVLDNIRYGHSEATMEQVIAAATAANAHEFIAKLPAGYDTKVGERGVRLSGGQKQRLSIARAFLANPTVLLLDEPTSSVEPDSEAAIIAALDRLMAGRTTVLTSHRPSLIRQADIAYLIEDGRVSDCGSPRELIERNAWFARFMRSSEDALV
jgi:ABC-type multidrug transport system fused ATPase/permease subunit